jgi:hypothetical protein
VCGSQACPGTLPDVGAACLLAAGGWREPNATEELQARRGCPDAILIALASEYGRSACRRITDTWQEAGWTAGKHRVQRIWRGKELRVQ